MENQFKIGNIYFVSNDLTDTNSVHKLKALHIFYTDISVNFNIVFISILYNLKTNEKNKKLFKMYFIIPYSLKQK